MRSVICLLVALSLFMCGCSKDAASTQKVDADNKTGVWVSISGVEYKKLANEGVLYYLGETEYFGSVGGEAETSQHMGLPYQTGMFSVKGNDTNSILIRRDPDNEWFAIYRKASLPEFDFSVDNCIRLELVQGIGDAQGHAVHIACGDGITNKAEIAAFLAEVRSQKSPKEAGVYELVRNQDGYFENCYQDSLIYGYFAEEPNVVLRMPITSYNDLAYSICIAGEEYVLPESWLQIFQNNG